MLPTQLSCRACGPHGDRRGFTLIELIVALTVISVATTIYVKLYLTCTDLGNLVQHRELAASIAEGQLAQMVTDPGGFVWEFGEINEQGFFRIRRTADDPRVGLQLSLPGALLPYEASYNHQKTVYEKFRWTAFGRLPDPSSGHVEIAVNVQWRLKGKVENVALTSAIHRSKADPNWVEN